MKMAQLLRDRAWQAIGCCM